MDHVTINGSRLECRWTGNRCPGFPDLVLLHEGLGSVSLWRDFPERLAQATGLAVFAYSRAGYGGSAPVDLPRPLDYLEREARDVLPLVLDAAGIGRAILVGHSDGASIALVAAALDGAGRIAGVAALAPHTFVEDMCLEAIAQATQAYEAGDLRQRLERHHGANVDCAFRGWNDTWLAPEFRRFDLRAYLPRIRVPLLVMQGEDDEYATAAQVQVVAEGIGGPVEAVLLPDCRHSPQRDQPQSVLAAISRLVARAAG